MSLIETIAGFALPQAAIPLRVLSWLRGSASWLRSHPMTALALLAAGFGGIEHHKASKWASLAQARGVALAAMRSADERAIQQATAAKESKDAFNTKLAADGDRTAADLRVRYHAAVLQLAAAQDSARRADLSSNAEASASGKRPGESADFFAEPKIAATAVIKPMVIDRDDALACADNTARLQAVHDWAIALGR